MKTEIPRGNIIELLFQEDGVHMCKLRMHERELLYASMSVFCICALFLHECVSYFVCLGITENVCISATAGMASTLQILQQEVFWLNFLSFSRYTRKVIRMGQSFLKLLLE